MVRWRDIGAWHTTTSNMTAGDGSAGGVVKTVIGRTAFQGETGWHRCYRRVFFCDNCSEGGMSLYLSTLHCYPLTIMLQEDEGGVGIPIDGGMFACY